jgi:hypothetical protein
VTVAVKSRTFPVRPVWVMTSLRVMVSVAQSPLPPLSARLVRWVVAVTLGGAGAADAASTASPRVPATAATATAALVRAAINHWHKVIGYQMVGL